MVFDFKIVDGLALSAMTSTIKDSLIGIECLKYGQSAKDNALILPFESMDELCVAKNIAPPKIPSMLSRRLTTGAKYAVQLASCFKEHNVDAVVFSSRHGELERCVKILGNIGNDQGVSPTDFSMSVHNVAVSQFLIANKLRVPYSSVVASVHTFVQSLYEIKAFLLAGYQTILYVDFDSQIPEIFIPHLSNDILSVSYASAFIIKRGGHLEVNSNINSKEPKITTNCPESLQFYGAWALAKNEINLYYQDGSCSNLKYSY